MAISDFINMADALSENEDLQPITNLITSIMEMDDSQLNEQSVDIIIGSIQGAFTDKVKKTATETIIKQFEDSGMNRRDVAQNAEIFKNEIKTLIEDLKPSPFKKQILENIFIPFYEIFDIVIERFHNFSITLPIMLEDGAQMPIYAHETDACADVYAYEDTLVPAHSLSNKIRTGLHFAIPEGWEIGLLPRSSIGSKTGLRLSNSRAVIDQQFRDEMIILYDNISDSDYQIKAGDRIAQMFVQPTYRFNGILISKTDFDKIEGDRGGGLGSTGK